ncbi:MULTISPECIES: bacillithiol biosynthesis cysteine-adding enzyme BshC [Aequorivita]|uniref:Putative cysteine ligase BshC n=1 Tax=Aequorivita iocasae TaxID=2803865 RepID=A0ABX7DNG5_9FLAO|nr:MULTISPECIES: bacillithiol biosynthesis cysteine-adding enzyme BshC [Aequorivita]QQX75645.1 bacillithiol biosynthesis cysteine-adding enzyme BshC [Aequorivita iocasae]UCA55101.1 bacillithiol biosynthesis cysteine-adding enzyme BshC [Aequorivita sp. F7]
MPTHSIPYKDTGYFSKLICDYLAEDEGLNPFYNRFPNLENFKHQLVEKQKNFTDEKRHLLSKRIMLQYGDNSISQSTLSNIDLLREHNTFTIITGHQLNLFTGPLYFLYKIFSTINLAEKLNKTYPNNHFVPVYWMATEDNDFEEINYFNLFGKKVKWDRDASGAVGELSTEGLKEVKHQLKKEFGESENAKKLISYFSDAYTKHDNLADATHFLANTLFYHHGLVIVDGNDAALKKCFIPYAEKELTENLSFKKVSETTEKLTALGFSEQVHPREINMFYLKEKLRERIIEKNSRFYVNETDISFSKEEILKELHENPERFSPNALLRPLYQEVILPNLCYIGGGGELAYWFQLKDYFNKVEVPFPILLLRNSVLLVPKMLSEKLQKLNVEIDDLFLPQHELISKHTREISKIEIDFSQQKEFLKKQFKDLYELAKQTDASFLGAVGAQEKKQLNGLDNLEKRLLKAQKRKLSDELDRLKNIQNQLFPNQSLQERQLNFSEFYLEYGESLLDLLKENLEPLDANFTILEL